jgi:hypothetical protein
MYSEKLGLAPTFATSATIAPMRHRAEERDSIVLVGLQHGPSMRTVLRIQCSTNSSSRGHDQRDAAV